MTEKKSCKYLDEDNICLCTGNRPDRKLAFCKAGNCTSCQWYSSADALGMSPELLAAEALLEKEDAPEETQPPAADEPETLPALAVQDLPEEAQQGADEPELAALAPSAQAAAPATAGDLSAFDHGALDTQTANDLELAEWEYMQGKRMAESGLRRMADAVRIAYETLCEKKPVGEDATKCRVLHGNNQYSKNTFGAWCDYIGLNRKMAERLLNVATLFDHSSPKQQAVLEELAPTLLYAAAKPSAPPQLVEGVKAGDITTHKQYREMEEKLKAAERAKREAERRAEAAEDKAYSAILHGREASNRAHEAEGRRLEAEERAQAAEAHAHELESRPVEVVGASPEDIARWKAEGEQAAAGRYQAAADAANAYAAQANTETAKTKKKLASAQRDAESANHRADVLAAQLREAKAKLQEVETADARAAALAAQLDAAQQQIADLSARLAAQQAPAAPSAGAIPAQSPAVTTPPEGAPPSFVLCKECALLPWCMGLHFDDGIQEFLGDPDAEDTLYKKLHGCTAGVPEAPDAMLAQLPPA